MRIAFTSDIAAATAASRSRSAPSAVAGCAAPVHRRSRRRNGRRAPFPPSDERMSTIRESPRAERTLVGALEELAPRGIDGLGILEVLLEAPT